ncbi:Endo-1, partial [Diplonema papillatum]
PADEENLQERERKAAEKEKELMDREAKVQTAEKRLLEGELENSAAKRRRRDVMVRPEQVFPSLPSDRADVLVSAYEEAQPGFWSRVDSDALRELALISDEKEAVEILDQLLPPLDNAVSDEEKEDDFALLDAGYWREGPIGAGKLLLLESAIARCYRFKENQRLQEQRHDTVLRIREHLRMRGTGTGTSLWVLKLVHMFDELEQQQAIYDTRDPKAGRVMRTVQETNRLPERQREARRRFATTYKQQTRQTTDRPRPVWEEKVETFEAAATTEGTAAQRASMAATVAKFAEATDLQQAPAVFKLKAFAAAMVDGGMSEAQLAKFVARESGKRGRPRKGNMRTTSVESYLSALGPKMGVSAAEMKETKRALLKRRLERREMPDHAHPLTLEEARSVMHAAADMEVVAAAALLWGCALRMADLLEIKPEDVTLTARGVLRIAWWTTKEAKLRLREVEVLYQLPPLQREKVKRWIGLKQPFQRATIRHLLALARKLVPGCAEHSWKRGALQHLAKSGAQWDELLLIARHTSIATLRRYLWGCVTPDHTRTARNRATAPQGDEKAAPQSNRATAPQGNEKAAPQSNKTAAPQGNDKAAPQSNRATAPQGNEKAAPQSNKTAAPQGYDKAAPQSNRAAAPQGNEKAAPQSNKTATPQGNDKTAPQSNKAAAPQGNKDAAPQSDKTAVSP